MKAQSAFERLHPAVQYHVVNSLGWQSLRPAQLDAIDPILDGRDCLVLAPTAGGKTEAVIIPLLSRASSEARQGLTVLYVCPIKALLDNLEQRLSRYAALVGCTVQVWHGDIGQGAKARALREQPDILLTTPESLEAMLISLRVDRKVWFGALRAVVVDELHAFAGDDRGRHLRAVLKRIDGYAPAPMQRIGRARVEQVGAGLRALGVRTFVSHSSLSAAGRRAAEQAFAEETDCVIVATSTLELGIDVGDLDYVLQIDSPTAVSSFLQRMGRTGRRARSRRNCTFLATNDEALLIACGIVGLWREGFIEPVVAPPEPWHLVAQQAMALILERGGLSLPDLLEQVATLFPELCTEGMSEVVTHMLAEGILCEVDGLIGFGRRGEELYGRQHFIDLVSSFDSPPLLLARHGAAEIGFVDPMSLRRDAHDDAPRVLLLGGRSWRVCSIEWNRRIVWVEPASEGGKSRWFGSSRALSFTVCQAIKRVLCDESGDSLLSRRAAARLSELREALPTLEQGKTTLERLPQGRYRWWTFAGGSANGVLGRCLPPDAVPRSDDFMIEASGNAVPGTELHAGSFTELVPGDAVPIEIKFGDCLPEDLERRMEELRLLDIEGAKLAAAQGCVQVSGKQD